jgi:hypothetical protein
MILHKRIQSLVSLSIQPIMVHDNLNGEDKKLDAAYKASSHVDWEDITISLV